jgi:hypothetical protein
VERDLLPGAEVAGKLICDLGLDWVGVGWLGGRPGGGSFGYSG